MRRHDRRSVIAAALLASAGGAAFAQGPQPALHPMTLTSSSFEDGGRVPDRYSLAVSNPVSPAFAWRDAPAATVSFLLILHDVDSLPRPGFPDNLHWLVFNIPPSTTSLPEGVPATPVLPDGAVQALNGSRRVGYLPLGARVVFHHYVAELYALDIRLPLGPEALRADVLTAIDGHVVAKAAYVGRFHR